MRLRTLVLTSLVALLSTGVSSAASARIDWESLPYFHVSSAELYVSTGPGWNGRVVPSHEQFPRGLVPAWATKRVPKPLWLGECGLSTQKPTFAFTFDAPGPAQQGSLEIVADTAGSLNAVSAFVVALNGREIARSSSSWGPSGQQQVQLGKQQLKDFRYGSNEIEIRATKPALPKGVKACNVGNGNSYSYRYAGVALGLDATFAADMQTDPPRVFEEHPLEPVGGDPHVVRAYLKAKPGFKGLVTALLKVRNAGPAASVEGKLVIDVKGDASLKVSMATSAASGAPPTLAPAPFTGCTATALALFAEYKATCPYTDFPPGKEVVVNAYFVFRLDNAIAANFTQRTVTFTWMVGGIADDGSANGEVIETAVLCGPAATDPGCANAR